MDEKARIKDERLLACKPQHLATLVAVAKARSFRVAGERLGYVQSAVSRQIASLEEEAGMRLVERRRGTNEVCLTQAGEVMLRHAEVLLARLDAARMDLTRLADGEIGTVRVGIPQGIGQRLLWAALGTFRRAQRSARVVASEFSNDSLLFEHVERGALDMAVAGLPLEPGPFDSCHLLSERWVLAVPSNWAMARAGDEVRLADLERKPLIGGHSARAAPPLEAQLRAAGCRPNVVFRTDLDSTVQSLVAAGVGAALLPADTVAGGTTGITVLPLSGITLNRAIGLFWHRERELTPAADRFRTTLREICSNRRVGLADDRPAAV